MIRVLILDVTKGLYEAEIEDNIHEFYKVLDCDCFDITSRLIGGVKYDIFVDDMGLFKDKPILTAIDSQLRPQLVGNLMFANHDMAGNTTSLSDEDIERIKSRKAYYVRGGKLSPIIHLD